MNDLVLDLALNSPFEETQKAFAENKDWKIRNSVAKNKNIFPSILIILSKDNSIHVRKLVAKNPKCTPELLEDLLNDEEERNKTRLFQDDIIVLIAKNPSASSSLLENILKIYYGISSIVDALISNPNLSSELIHKIITNHHIQFYSETLVKIAKHPRTSEETFRELIDSKMMEDPYLRNVLAQNPNLPSDCLYMLAMRTKETSTHYWIAKHPNCPMSLMKKYCKRHNNLYALAQNPKLPESIALEIIKSNEERGIPNQEAYFEALIFNPKATKKVLEIIIEKGDKEMISKAKNKLRRLK